MAGTNAFNQDVLQLIFEAQAIANLADNAGTSPLTNLYISLHTASPGETGDQTTNEATYTSYARVAVARTAAGWTVTNADPAVCDNDSAITFAEATGGSNTITNWGIGSSASGAGVLYFHGAFDSSLAVSTGITPEIAAGELNITLD